MSKVNLETERLYAYGKIIGQIQINILLLSKKVSTKTKNFSFEMLDKLLGKYYELKLMSFAEMQEYEANKSN